MKICNSCKRDWKKDSFYCPWCGCPSYTSTVSLGPPSVSYHEETEPYDEEAEMDLAHEIEEQLLKQLDDNLEAYREKLEKAKKHISVLAARCDYLNDSQAFYHMPDSETDEILSEAHKFLQEIDKLLEET